LSEKITVDIPRMITVISINMMTGSGLLPKSFKEFSPKRIAMHPGINTGRRRFVFMSLPILLNEKGNSP
jgi:hypothetical protein